MWGKKRGGGFGGFAPGAALFIRRGESYTPSTPAILIPALRQSRTESQRRVRDELSPEGGAASSIPVGRPSMLRTLCFRQYCSFFSSPRVVQYFASVSRPAISPALPIRGTP